MRHDGTTADEGTERKHLNSSGEFVSGKAFQILDEIGLRLLEIRFALVELVDEVEMRFDEFDPALDFLERLTQDAVQAVGLMLLDAELDPRWGNHASRPRGILARHAAATSRGAARVFPPRSTTEVLEGVMLGTAGPFDTPDWDSRPPCPGTVRDQSRRCSKGSLYLGDGDWASGCQHHASDDERRRYREHRTTGNSTITDAQIEFFRDIGARILNQWLRERHTVGSLYNDIHRRCAGSDES